MGEGWWMSWGSRCGGVFCIEIEATLGGFGLHALSYFFSAGHGVNLCLDWEGKGGLQSCAGVDKAASFISYLHILLGCEEREERNTWKPKVCLCNKTASVSAINQPGSFSIVWILVGGGMFSPHEREVEYYIPEPPSHQTRRIVRPTVESSVPGSHLDGIAIRLRRVFSSAQI